MARPPYRTFRSLTELPHCRPPGTILALILEPDALLEEASPAVDTIRTIREDTLDCAFIGRPAADARSVDRNLQRRLGAVGVRAFVPDGASPTVLRRTLQHAGFLPNDVSLWVRLRLRRPGVQAVAPVLGRLACGESINDAAVDTCRKTLETGVPTVHKWKMAGKVMPALHRLQTEPGTTVESAARGSPYSTPGSFGRACRNLFAASPSTIRRRLGWEWLLDRFVDRKI